MSTILEALKKSQQLKKNLSQQQNNVEEETNIISTRKNYKTLLLLMFVIVVLVFLLITESPYLSGILNEGPTLPSITAIKKPTAKPVEQSQNVTEPIAQPQKQTAKIKPQLEESTKPQQNKLVSTKNVTNPPATAESTIINKIEETKKQLALAKNNKAQSRQKLTNNTKNIPTLEDLPEDIKNNLPTLNLIVHVYAKEIENRFIILNMKRLTNGDALDNQIKLIEITEAGAILQYKKQQFKLEQ